MFNLWGVSVHVLRMHVQKPSGEGPPRLGKYYLTDLLPRPIHRNGANLKC